MISHLGICVILLAAAGDADVPAATQRVRDELFINKSPDEWLTVVERLISKHGEADVLEGLVGVTGLDEQELRFRAVVTLGKLGKRAAKAGRTLQLLTLDDHDDIRWAAICALGGLADESAIPRMAEILQAGKSVSDRVGAASSLGQIGTQAAVVELVKGVKDPDVDVRAAMVLALGELRTFPEIALPPLREMLKDTGQRTYNISLDFATRRPVCYDALEALANYGASAQPAGDEIARIMSADRDPMAQVIAAFAAVRIHPGLKEPMAVLLKGLDHDDAEVESESALRLGQLGKDAKAAVPQLLRLLDTAGHDVRSSAALALGEIGAKPETVVPALAAALSDEDAWVKGNAAASLAKFGRAAKSAIPKLTELLTNRADPPDLVDELARNEALLALRKIARPEELVPVLVDALVHERSPDFKVSIIQQLAALGRRGSAALPFLESLTKEKDGAVRGAARDAIDRIRP